MKRTYLTAGAVLATALLVLPGLAETDAEPPPEFYFTRLVYENGFGPARTRRSIERNPNGLLQILTPVTRGMLEDFIRQNTEPRRLSENLELNVRYVRKAIFGEHFWETFR